MFHPWFGPLMLASANTIALRTWLMVPADGRYNAWQQREASRMVGEKVAAVQEAQLKALSLAWRMWFMPWTVFTAPTAQAVQRAMRGASEEVARPFGQRAAANARRLTTRAADPAHAMAPALELVRRTSAWPGSNVIPLRFPARRRRRG